MNEILMMNRLLNRAVPGLVISKVKIEGHFVEVSIQFDPLQISSPGRQQYGDLDSFMHYLRGISFITSSVEGIPHNTTIMPVVQQGQVYGFVVSAWTVTTEVMD